MSARIAAVRALIAVERGDHADVALSRELMSMDRRERALATELVYGSLRRRSTIDHVLGCWLRRPLSSLTPYIRIILRTGAYQLLYLDRIPAHAAVNEAVGLGRKFGHKGTAGIINAVLRRIADQPTVDNLPADEVERLAIVGSHPRWLIARWLDRYGYEGTEQLCEWNNRAAPVVIRPNRLRVSSEQLQQVLCDEGVSSTAAGLLEGEFRGLVIDGFDMIDTLDAFQRGLFQVQDEAAMLASVIADPAGGWSVLDACAGYGGKTTHLAELMGNRGQIVAVDPNKEKLEQLQIACRRLGIDCVRTWTGDVREFTEDGFDLVLVDAPCTGTGVLRRNPDARWRRCPDDIERLAELGLGIVDRVSKLVKPGGVIVYVTCSLEPEENDGVVDRLLVARSDLTGDNIQRFVPSKVRSAVRQDRIQLLPHVHGSDGMFICRLRRQ